MRALLFILIYSLLPTFGADLFVPYFDTPGFGNKLKVGLLAFWQFEETGQTAGVAAVDASGNNRNLLGGATPASYQANGIVGNARSFHKDDVTVNSVSGPCSDYFSRADEAVFAFGTGAGTITAWAFFDSNNTLSESYNSTIICSGDWNSTHFRWWLIKGVTPDSTYMDFYYSTDGLFNPTNVVQFAIGGRPIGAGYYFIALRWDGFTLYLSATHSSAGTLAAETTWPFAGPFYNGAGADLIVGQPSVNECTGATKTTLHDLEGNIDEMGIWNVCLSPCQLGKLFSAKGGNFTYKDFDTLECK